MLRPPRVPMEYISIASRSRSDMVDITQHVADLVQKSGMKEGVCHLFVMHTTAAITVNEAADPAVQKDMISFLDRLIPQDSRFSHGEGNSDAHIKTSLVGQSLTLLVEKGELVLGTWQSVFLCEFDGPRQRKVAVKVMAG